MAATFDITTDEQDLIQTASSPYSTGSSRDYEKERDIFRLFSLIFAARGSNSVPQREDGFKKTIDALKGHIDMANLLLHYGQQEVLRVAKKLAEDGVFDSESKARSLFPQTFSMPTIDDPLEEPMIPMEVQEKRRETKRKKRQRQRQKAREKRTSKSQAPPNLASEEQAFNGGESCREFCENSVNGPRKQQKARSRFDETAMPRASPICLPIDVQMNVLSHLRSLIQDMCRDRVNEMSMPFDLDEMWNTVATDNLHEWWQDYQGQIGEESDGTLNECRTLDQIVLSLEGIHLILVNEEPVPVKAVNRFVLDAVILARTWGSQRFKNLFEDWYRMTRSATDEFRHRCQLAHLDLENGLLEISKEGSGKARRRQKRRQKIDDYNSLLSSFGSAAKMEIEVMLTLVGHTGYQGLR